MMRIVGAEAVARLSGHPWVRLLDVRPKRDFARARLPGAQRAPLSSVRAFIAAARRAAPNREHTVVVYGAAAGERRRLRKAGGLLLTAGYPNILLFLGGMRAWRAARLRVEKR